MRRVAGNNIIVVYFDLVAFQFSYVLKGLFFSPNPANEP